MWIDAKMAQKNALIAIRYFTIFDFGELGFKKKNVTLLEIFKYCVPAACCLRILGLKSMGSKGGALANLRLLKSSVEM